jgi:hypothetical protein
MAVATFASQRRTARDLIARYGVRATFRRASGKALDPVEQATVAEDVQSFETSAIVTPYRPLQSRGMGTSLAGESLRTTNARALDIAGEGIPWIPQPGDEVTFAGTSWVVGSVVEEDPDGEGAIVLHLTVTR